MKYFNRELGLLLSNAWLFRRCTWRSEVELLGSPDTDSKVEGGTRRLSSQTPSINLRPICRSADVVFNRSSINLPNT